MRTKCFECLSDEDLITETKRLAADERLATAALIRSLVELDSRRLYLAHGCATLFTYCTEVLRLSEDAAYNRVEVASAARKVPALLDCLEAGTLTLTAARRLAPHLTEANAESVLAVAQGKKKREIEQLLATLDPKPDLKPCLRELFPLSAERFGVQFTISAETRAKLDEVQDLLSHSVRRGDLAEIFDRALTLLLKDARRQRYSDTEAPRPGRELRAGSRQVPAAVQRAVWKRDEGRCAFVGPNGRCTETAFLQFHHDDPYAMGGAATVDNVHLRCAAHNRYEAELFFGVNYPGIVREGHRPWPERDFVPERRTAAYLHAAREGLR
jgi:hypothetical protein